MSRLGDTEALERIHPPTNALAVMPFGLVEKPQADPSDPDYGDAASESYRVGGLNLLVCSTAERLESWRAGTELLRESKPVSRAIAVGVFKSLFASESRPRKGAS